MFFFELVILEDSHIGLDFTGQCCTQTCTRVHLLKVNIQRHTLKHTRPAGDRYFTPDPEIWHLRLTEAAGVPMLRCQKSYPTADININIVIVSLWPPVARPGPQKSYRSLPPVATAPVGRFTDVGMITQSRLFCFCSCWKDIMEQFAFSLSNDSVVDKSIPSVY